MCIVVSSILVYPANFMPRNRRHERHPYTNARSRGSRCVGRFLPPPPLRMLHQRQVALDARAELPHCTVHPPPTQGYFRPTLKHLGTLNRSRTTRLRNFLAGGTFAATFFLACLAVLEMEGVRLED